MKKCCLLFCIAVIPFYVCAENQIVDLGRFNFSLSPKILKDGSITDIGLGIMYTDTLGGELRFRNTNISKNEELLGVSDSLNAVTENSFELFILPIKYYVYKTASFRLWSGAGLYYNFNTLAEKGFFNMPALETMNPPRERVNSYTNNFSMHLLGPLADIGISYTADWFNVAFSGGIIPVFFLHSSQEISIVPLLDPNHAEFSQDTWGSPHFYVSLDSILFKYVNLVLLYDFAKLHYRTLDFNDNLKWITPERSIATQSFKIEASVLLPMGGNMRGQIGYGYTFDTTRIDAGVTISGNRQYLILTAKKINN